MRESLQKQRSKMVSCPQFCHAVKQLPGLEQMGNLSLGYFMESAQGGDGPQQLEIHLISDNPPPTFPSWERWTSSTSMCLPNACQALCKLLVKKLWTLTQNHFLYECKPWNTNQMDDIWRTVVKTLWLCTTMKHGLFGLLIGKSTVWSPHLHLGGDFCLMK